MDPAQIRHIVLITDGQAHYGEFGALVRAARADAISISTIAIGDDAEIELLQTIAANAGGRFHATVENGRFAGRAHTRSEIGQKLPHSHIRHAAAP